MFKRKKRKAQLLTHAETAERKQQELRKILDKKGRGGPLVGRQKFERQATKWSVIAENAARPG